MPVHAVSGRPGCYRYGKTGKIYCGKGARAKAERQAAAIRASGYKENQLRVINAQKILFTDPTRTKTLRKSAETQISKRFTLLRKSVEPTRNDIERALATWVGDWRLFLERAYTQGVRRSWTDVNAVLDQSKLETKIRRDQFLRDLSPTAEKDITQLSDRVYSEMQNVASNTYTKIQRIIADNLPANQTKKLIREELDKGQRAGYRVVHTEIIRAHARGQLAALKQSGVSKVGVMVEWTTSGLGLTAKGNPSPCPQCSAMRGVVFKIEEAYNLIPRHPFCLCSFTPVLEPSPEQIRSKREVQRALRRSVKAGSSEGWKGSTLKIGSRRK